MISCAPDEAAATRATQEIDTTARARGIPISKTEDRSEKFKDSSKSSQAWKELALVAVAAFQTSLEFYKGEQEIDPANICIENYFPRKVQ